MPESDPQFDHQSINSLVTKIVLMIFIGSFAATAIVSWASIKPAQESLARSIDVRYLAAAKRAGESADSWLSAGREQLVRSSESHSARPTESELAAWLRANPHLEGISLCAGSELSARAGSAPGCPPAVSASLLQRKWTAIPRAAGVQLPVALVPIAANGASELFAVGAYDRARLGAILEQHRPTPDASVLLTTKSGAVLAGGGSDPSLRIAAPGPEEANASGVREAGNTPWRNSIHATQPLGDSEWRVDIEVPFGTAYASLLVMIRRVLLVDLIAILVLSLVAYRVTSAVLKPIESLSAGARRVAQGDFDLEIPVPGARDEIGVLVGAFNEMLKRVRAYRDEINQSNENLRVHNVKLQQANELLEQLSITDGLTKLHNHRFFQDQLTREIRRSIRTSTPLSLLLIDIDDFKSLNDRFGHAAGDELLHGLALIMNATVRSSDLLARYGGEEFAVLAPDTDTDGAYLLAEKIRTAIAESSFILGDSMRLTRATVSVGISLFKGERKKFFDEADRALYRAKGAGKNCVMVDEGGDAE